MALSSVFLQKPDIQCTYATGPKYRHPNAHGPKALQILIHQIHHIPPIKHLEDMCGLKGVGLKHDNLDLRLRTTT